MCLTRFARGTYSYISTTGEGKDHDRLAEPVLNRLFFAGEAAMREHPATVAGAYLSGLIQAGLIDEVNSGLFKMPQEAIRLSKEHKEEMDKKLQTRRKKRQQQEQNRSYQRGKRGLRVKPTKLNETYAWLFTSNYKIPKKKPSSAESLTPDPTSPNMATNLSLDLIPSTRRLQKDQKFYRVVSKSSMENLDPANLSNPVRDPNPTLLPSSFPPLLIQGDDQNNGLHPSNIDLSPQIPSTTTPLNNQPLSHFSPPIPASSPLKRQDSDRHLSHLSVDNMIEDNRNSISSPQQPHSPEQEKKFKQEVGTVVVSCLSKHYKEKASKEEFKHLARKLTHLCIQKEKKNHSQFIMNEEIKKKISKFIGKYLEHMKETKEPDQQ